MALFHSQTQRHYDRLAQDNCHRIPVGWRTPLEIRALSVPCAGGGGGGGGGALHLTILDASVFTTRTHEVLEY